MFNKKRDIPVVMSSTGISRKRLTKRAPLYRGDQLQSQTLRVDR